MVDDPNRKTPRTFQCRDYLWESFETMSGELECSIDYLVNEAMRHYLRAQGRSGPTRTTLSGNERAVPTPGPAVGTNSHLRPTPLEQRAVRQPTVPPPGYASPRPSMPGPPARSMPPPAMPPSYPTQAMRPSPAHAPTAEAMRAVQPPRQAPPPAAAQRPQEQRLLYAVYDRQEVPVAKEEFVIGRTQRMCDLVIRDTNISRQHARVVLHNGAWWIIDNQSTNGVEFRGAKIQQKRVDDGDVFTICGHDVQFVYR